MKIRKIKLGGGFLKKKKKTSQQRDPGKKQFAPLANGIAREKFCHKHLLTTEFN